MTEDDLDTRHLAEAALGPPRSASHQAQGDPKEQGHADHEHAVAVREAEPETERPPLFKVVLHNDDYTPMDFVIDVLQTFFGMSHELATQVMLHVHTRGKGVCGVFTREVAETKVGQVNEYSRHHLHPLLCGMEMA